MATFVHHLKTLRLSFSPRSRSVVNIYPYGDKPAFSSKTTTRQHSSSTMSSHTRTYETALSHLAALQSNSLITSLFTPTPITTPTTTTSPQNNNNKKNLNDLAIPEMLAWLRRAGITQTDLAASKLRCIHVAGTKGKGSTCAYLTALLVHGTGKKAGKVGTYTSPHLLSVRERIAIDGNPISQDLFAGYFFELWDAFTRAARAELAAAQSQSKAVGGEEMISEEELQGPATKPFYFRFLTILALRIFLGEGVRSAIIECGIGGEYDSTNILPAECVTASVITQLGIDHVGMLGPTLPQIAWHKAGVCKEGRKCYTRRLNGEQVAEETMRVLRRRAAEKNALLVEIADEDVEKASWHGGSGSMEGDFQKYNQALAIHAAREHLRVLGTETETEIEPDTEIDVSVSALQHARLRGRCETYEDKNITWLIDGAHTAESLTEVARWFSGKLASSSSSSSSNRKLTPPKDKIILLFNQQDRDANRLVSRLLRDIRPPPQQQQQQQQFFFTHAIFSRNDLSHEPEAGPNRDLSVQEAAARTLHSLSPDTKTMVVDNVAEAVGHVRNLAHESDNTTTTVLATGSLHLVGALLRTLEPDSAL
ncbi:FolC bifunctional protein [Poronia punctata]|nr:FolC bifunctional protein [Poronia punctata]